MESETLNIVRKLALEGSTHFPASFVAEQTGIPPGEAHNELEALRSRGVLDVHFDILCPETDRTIQSYGLGEKVPLGEVITDKSGDCEPFELTESSLLVTYSPSQKFLIQLNRERRQHLSKKKRSIWRRIQRIFSPRLHRMRSTRRRTRSMWSTS